MLLFHIVSILLFTGLFISGTFNDEAVSALLFTPGSISPIAVIITTLGIYPYTAVMVTMYGVLARTADNSELKKALKSILRILLGASAVIIGYSGAANLLSTDCIGELFPVLCHNKTACIVTDIIMYCPLFFIGYKTAPEMQPGLLVRKILVFLAVLLSEFVLMQVFKNMFCRPRPRVVVCGYEGIEFMPWYTPFKNAAEMLETYGLEKTDLRSFPSGHSILSFSCIYIFPSLAWIFPKLKDKQNLLTAAGFIFGIIVMFTRLILGAHYLSDISAGAIIAVMLSLIFSLTEHSVGKIYESRTAHTAG